MDLYALAEFLVSMLFVLFLATLAMLHFANVFSLIPSIQSINNNESERNYVTAMIVYTVDVVRSECKCIPEAYGRSI